MHTYRDIARLNPTSDPEVFHDLVSTAEQAPWTEEDARRFHDQRKKGVMGKPLPELGVIVNPHHYASWGHKVLTVPEKCPHCGAKRKGELGYECGAEYGEKPQCQTHTRVWWGSCPVTPK
jgi:hypothetical protein